MEIVVVVGCLPSCSSEGGGRASHSLQLFSVQTSIAGRIILITPRVPRMDFSPDYKKLLSVTASRHVACPLERLIQDIGQGGKEGGLAFRHGGFSGV